MTPEQKFNILMEYPGFVFIQDLKTASVMYHCHLVFPNGDESTRYYDTDRDEVISQGFEQYYILVSDICDTIERTKTR